MEAFKIEMAGVPVAVRCRFHENQAFFHDYFTELEPLFTVEPTEADLTQMQADYDRMDEMEGIPKHRRLDSFLENNAIHSLLAERLVEQNVLLMHGSALCMDGEAYIFTAPSGTGKSTHAQLWREAFGDRVWMINDDKPLIRVQDGKAMVYGSPWDGKHHLSRNASAPLRAILWLSQSAENRLKPMAKADAYQMLFRQSYSSKNAEIAVRILALEMKLLDMATFYQMECNMEIGAALTAWKGVNET